MAAEITPPHTVQKTGGQWLYVALMAIQTTGAVVILWNVLPIYRQIVADASKHAPQPETLVWSAVAVAMIQSAFWLGRRLHPRLPQGRYLLTGQLVLFFARLCFVLATSTFSVVFVTRPHQLTLPPLRVVMLLAVLFSIFCYTQELERLGRSLQGLEEKKVRTDQP
jgi:cation transport ATPase